jgi:hypothetical protein
LGAFWIFAVESRTENLVLTILLQCGSFLMFRLPKFDQKFVIYKIQFH